MATIEQKAKAYDEALERARIWKDKSGIPKDRQGILDDIFPELKENEDEKMLREIKRYIKEQGNKPTGLPNGTAAVADMLAWLEKHGEQKPAWSEEDERCLINTIDACKQMSDEDYDYSQSYIDAINWLKSLKDRVQPQKQWKPSEKQIKALHDLNLTGGISYAGQGQVLIELYNDLKKLKRRINL